jgi:rare lipoprotein A
MSQSPAFPALFSGTIGAAIIIGIAAWFIVYSVPRAEAGEPKCKAGEVRVSWYGKESGNRTATGRKFNGSQWLVAHKTLRMGTRVRFTYHGRSVVAPVGDRGPYIRGRSYDLSEAVARALGTKGAGVACVVAKVL